MKSIIILLALVLSSVGAAWAQKETPTPDPIIQFSDHDAAMNAAIEEARRTYPQFLAAFNGVPAHSSGNYMVKVGMTTVDGGVEHIWVDNLRMQGDRLFGALANEPAGLPGLHRGSAVEVDHALVSDWAILTEDGMYGSFTTRVMLPYMDPAEAAELRQMLTPTPLPPSWST